jgi:tRNA pseudouridine38-40 synthase
LDPWFQGQVEMLKFKLTLAYDGSGYHGWQSRPEGTGVQDHVEAALARLFVSAPRVESASRTDSGVHARGMVAHFELPREELRMPEVRLVVALNACLPEDVRVVSAVRVPQEFHARFDAVGKQYRYRVWSHPVMDPLSRGVRWHVPQRLDLTMMREAADHLTGTHDFRAFTARRDGVLGDPVRTLTRCGIVRKGSELTFVIEGSGFLYKMCRGLVGTLVQVGQGKFTPRDVAAMLESKDRRDAGVNAPAHGLVLWRVFYSPDGRES